MTGSFIGYDPGGNGRHGCAVLTVEAGRPARLRVTTHATTEHVLRDIETVGDVLGIGVDTLTCWSTGPSGWRPADRWLRARYPSAVGRSVAAPNSLYGSMSVGGMAVLLSLARRVPVTETHPKVLWHVLFGTRYAYATASAAMDARLGEAMGLPLVTANDHEWDAAASALTALRAHEGAWTRDLHRLPTRPDERLVEPYGPTRFVWPD